MSNDSWDPPRREQLPLPREDKIAIFWVLAGFEGLLRGEAIERGWIKGCSAFNWVPNDDEAPIIVADHVQQLIGALRRDLGDY